MHSAVSLDTPEINPDERTRKEWYADFAAALRRPVETRLANAFIRTYKPVLDDGPGIRMFDSMDQYREWCERELPEWLGYHR